ncbi:MAG: hypothetical protein IKR76_10480 [Ruminococcus sp.]|nr:hypothetical protein [Ruminococcus sp.]
MKRKLIFAVTAAVVLFGVGFAAYKLLHKEDNTSPEAVPVQEAADELKDYTFGEYDNLRFECEVKNTDFDAIYEEIEIGWTGEDDTLTPDELKKRVSDFGKKVYGLDISNGDILYDKDNGVEAYGRYEKDDTLIHYYYNDTFNAKKIDNSIDISEPFSSDEEENERIRPKIIKRFKPDDDYENEVYDINGQKYALKDAVEFANKKVDDCISQFLHEKPVLTDIGVVYFPHRNSYAYLLKYSHLIDGVLVDGVWNPDIDNDFFRGSALNIEIYEKDQLSMISNICYYTVLNKTPAKKILSLSEAEKIAADSLAPAVSYIVTGCELKYVCITHQKPDRTVFKPMWVFVIDECKDNDEYQSGMDAFPKMQLYIDAVNGNSMIYEKEHGMVR